MAIVIKKKTEELSERQKNALDAVGLAPKEPVPHVPYHEQYDKKNGLLSDRKLSPPSVGDKIKIVNNLFPWMEHYQTGDTGKVLRMWTAPDTPHTKRPRDDIYEVQLDTIRQKGKGVALFACWELEPV